MRTFVEGLIQQQVFANQYEFFGADMDFGK